MSGLLGGSAYAMARDIAGGYIMVTERTFHRLGTGDMSKLAHEIERALRELRGANVVSDDTTAVQRRARKIQRLQQALTILRAAQTRQRHG